LNRRGLKKILFVTTIIYILSAGIVLASSGCLLNCCGYSKGHSSHHGSTPSGHDPPHDCPSDSKGSSCHRPLNFIAAGQKNNLRTEFMEENFTAFSLDAAADSAFSLNRFNHYFSYLKKLHIKIPSVQLYLSNLSLLF
jgi:hypothetical protein